MKFPISILTLLYCLFIRQSESGFIQSELKQLIQLQKLIQGLDNADSPTQISNLVLNNSLKVNINELSFKIYTRTNPTGSKLNFTDASNIDKLSSFNTELKTVIYVHGWLDKIDLSHSILVKDSLLNASELNVLLLNWDKCANHINYLSSWGCVEGVGNYLGEFLNTVRDSYGYSLDNITIVGHSLGAHIAGYAGKKTNGSLGVIVALDPAALMFFKAQKNHRLNENDAKYVQAIHTCATGIVGLTYNVGRADFWPNGGSHQTGCSSDVFQCPHMRSIVYYAESISSDYFVGRKCDNYKNYENGKCNAGSKGVMGGLNVNITIQGDYYLDTNSESPFGKGDV